MSELVLMRQRIKAVDTIKKITHAMRLISMSTHSRLRAKKTFLEQYMLTLSSLYSKVHSTISTTDNPIAPNNSSIKRALHILVGSQKGLCGNFNTSLYAFYAHQSHQTEPGPIDLITIGKKIGDYTTLTKHVPMKRFDEFNSTMLPLLIKDLTHIIMDAQPRYDSVIIYSNYQKTFFVQKAHETILIPTTITHSSQEPIDAEYIWEQEPSVVLKALTEQLLYTTIKTVLLQSLIAEQAARFISMDSSTRNANTLITNMRLEYNKLRQTKITRELTDLAGNF